VIYRLSDAYSVRRLLPADLDGPYPTWFEDQDVTRFNSHGKLFKSRAYFAEYVNSLDQDDRVVWAICHVEHGHIGNVSLQSISLINRTAEFAIILGDRRHWSKGVGRLAGRQLLRHGFDKLNLERIYCGTSATNEGMKALAQSLGMRLEGTRRRHLFLDGTRVDMLEYGVLREEFTGGLSP